MEYPAQSSSLVAFDFGVGVAVVAAVGVAEVGVVAFAAAASVVVACSASVSLAVASHLIATFDATAFGTGVEDSFDSDESP